MLEALLRQYFHALCGAAMPLEIIFGNQEDEAKALYALVLPFPCIGSSCMTELTLQGTKIVYYRLINNPFSPIAYLCKLAPMENFEGAPFSINFNIIHRPNFCER